MLFDVHSFMIPANHDRWITNPKSRLSRLRENRPGHITIIAGLANQAFNKNPTVHHSYRLQLRLCLAEWLQIPGVSAVTNYTVRSRLQR